MTTILLIFLVVGSVTALPRIHNKSFPQKIIGGTPATKGEFPHIVQIQYNDFHLCGGSIVNENWVVTAAHCADGSNQRFTLVAGEHDVNVVEGTEQSRTVSAIILHPNYNPIVVSNDIALMRVSSPFTFDTYVGPVTIPNSSFTPADMLTVAGWGASGGQFPATLMKVDVPLVDLNVCNSGGSLPAGVICAGAPGKGFCQKDDGGPLMSADTLAGIASWGFRCGDPAVYTEVAAYSNWIMSITQ